MFKPRKRNSFLQAKGGPSGTNPEKSFPSIGKEKSSTTIESRKFIVDEEFNDPNTLPESVVETMAGLRLSWDFMMPEEFSPTPYALSLMEGSSVGKNFKEFCNVFATLEECMDLIVNSIYTQLN